MLLAKNEKTALSLLPALANRHGLITGATGTGKTLLVWDDNRDFIEVGREVYGRLLASDLTPIGAERPTAIICVANRPTPP